MLSKKCGYSVEVLRESLFNQLLHCRYLTERNYTSYFNRKNLIKGIHVKEVVTRYLKRQDLLK